MRERSGYSPDLIRSMLADNTLWAKPLQICRKRANSHKKDLWIGIGAGLFMVVAFIWPTPRSLADKMLKYGYGFFMLSMLLLRIIGFQA